jgi:hypothetical protein
MKWMENNWKGMMGFLGLMLLISSASNLSVALTNQRKINAIRSDNQDFKSRTVERWHYLQQENPALKVPQVVEPSATPEP